jgi:predicted RNA-binding protein with PIN domain
MPYLIDGNNLMARRIGFKLGLEEARRRLLEELAQFALIKRVRLSVVFDGAPNPFFPDGAKYRGITVFYARRGSNADERIKRLVNQSRERRTLIVVTSDRALAQYVRRCGAQTISAQEFIGKMDEARSIAEEEHRELQDDIRAWLRYFGVEPEDDAP